MDPLLITIISIIGGSLLGTISWLLRNWINNLLKGITSSFLSMKEDFTARFEALHRDIEDIKDIQSKQNITMAEVKAELHATKNIVSEVKTNVDDHTKKIHALEVEQARLSQWKKDKEDSKGGKF